MWGENANNSTSVNAATTSVGGFWEEPTRATTQKANITLGTTSGNKAISKSQTVSHIQSQSLGSKQIAASSVNKPTKPIINTTTNSTNNNNAIPKKAKPNNPAKKSSTNSDSNGNNEFTAWCSKALSAHVDVIDGNSNNIINLLTFLYLSQRSIYKTTFYYYYNIVK